MVGVSMPIRKFAGHNTATPPGTVVPTEGLKRLVDELSRRSTWGRPLTGKESPEEAYARGLRMLLNIMK